MSRAVELAKECGAVLIDGANDYGNHEVFAELWLTQLEAFYHAARAEALREATDKCSVGIGCGPENGCCPTFWEEAQDACANELRAMADREGKQ